jgi:hypothetical protein
MVWMIVRRRARTAVTRLSEVRPRLKRCRRELASERITGVERQFRRGDWDVDDEPVPKAAAGRRVRIVAGYGEAFRSAWRAGPHQMRRLIASRATEAEVFREYMSCGKVVSVAKALAASLTDIDSVPLRKAPPARGHFRASCWRMQFSLSHFECRGSKNQPGKSDCRACALSDWPLGLNAPRIPPSSTVVPMTIYAFGKPTALASAPNSEGPSTMPRR